MLRPYATEHYKTGTGVPCPYMVVRPRSSSRMGARAYR